MRPAGVFDRLHPRSDAVLTHAEALAAAAVVGAPGQEAARLVFADLLSDAGDPHGEFIVVQCQLAQYERDAQTKSTEYAQLKLRERAAELTLRQRRAHLWDAGLIWRKFDRGFVTRLEVRKADAVSLLGELSNDPLFSAVCRLEIAEGTPLAIDALTSTPTKFPSLKSLRIARKYATHGFGEAGAKKLAAWEVLRTVIDLRVRNEQLDDAGLTALLTSPNVPALERLTVGHNSAGLRDVFRLETWPMLRALELSSCQLTANEIDDLVRVQRLSNLESLSLAANHLGDDGAKVIATSDLALTELDLAYTGLTDAGLLAVVDSPGKRFEKLVLTSADVGPSVVRMARKHRSLKSLMLNETQVDDQHVAAMCGTLDGSLERLSLQGTSVSVKSVEALRACPKLKALSLARTEIGTAGIEVLANSAEMASLEQLDLDSATIDVEGCRALLASPFLSRTLDLSLSTAGLPESMVVALRSRFALA